MVYYNSQYSFRKKHSTELATLEIIDRIIQELDKLATPINIYFHLPKAFDHNILLHKLNGLNDTALEIENVKSEETVITTGVPKAQF